MNKEKIVRFFNQILNVYDFKIMIDINNDSEKVFRLIDIQKGNLGNIEQEEFSTLADIIDRLDIYHQDFIYTPLDNKQNNNEKIAKDDWDLTAKRYIESNTIAKVLNQVYPKEYTELLTQEEFKIQDIIEILDEDEKFYKSVCQKYVNTFSKEMLVEKDNKIYHIFIDDDYIPLKEKGKITPNNYQEYLDGDYEVYEYNFYQDFYNSTVKDEIANDLNDLALFDEDGNWDFYITFEELKKMGYAFMVKDQFPLIEKYAVPEDKIFDFFNYFSLEQLENFEESLRLYFIENSIIYEEYDGLSHFEAKENYSFNRDILRLACGLVTYEDFIEDYSQHYQTHYDLSVSKVATYFRNNEIKNLMDYGSDGDEGLYHLSFMYKELMDELNIKYLDVYTEDVSDGKYVTTITFDNNSSINIYTSAFNGIKDVTNNMESIFEAYEKPKANCIKNDIEISI